MDGLDSICVMLGTAHWKAESLAAEHLFEGGVSPLEARVLAVIARDPPFHASQVAVTLGVHVSTVTRALRRMEGYGYLTVRKGSFRDARAVQPELTRLGHSVPHWNGELARAIDAELTAKLRPSEVGLLYAGLCRITARGKK